MRRASGNESESCNVAHEQEKQPYRCDAQKMNQSGPLGNLTKRSAIESGKCAYHLPRRAPAPPSRPRRARPASESRSQSSQCRTPWPAARRQCSTTGCTCRRPPRRARWSASSRPPPPGRRLRRYKKEGRAQKGQGKQVVKNEGRSTCASLDDKQTSTYACSWAAAIA
jgi:hypothetical protein